MKLLLSLGLLGALVPCALVPFAHAAPKPAAGKPAAGKPAPKPASKPLAKPTEKPTPRPTLRPNAAPTPTPEPVQTGPKTWALLVGVSRYQNSNIAGLRFPAKDAAALRDALSSPQLGGVPASQILLLTDENATREKISGAVSSFLKPNVQSGDKVIVFLAGHGVAKGTGAQSKGFLLPHDTRGLTLPALESSAVSLRALTDEIGALPASQFVLLVDACREDPTPGRSIGAAKMSDILARSVSIQPQNADAQSATFFACQLGQRAFEDEQFGHGVFTHAILQGLQKGVVAQKPDNSVDMGRLSSYVRANVSQWAKDASARGDFDVEQTPELEAHQVSGPMILLNLKRAPSEAPFAPAPPRVFVLASPEGAQVSLNGARAGVGSVERELPSEGEVMVTISKPGYQPVSRSVKALAGYEHQVIVQLQPLGAGGGAATTDRASELFGRALEAQGRGQWEIAEVGFRAALGANPAFRPAHESLVSLHQAGNRNAEAVASALGLLAANPRDAASLALLSRVYSHYAQFGAGASPLNVASPEVSGYNLPKKPTDAPKLAVKAAKEALALDPASSSAQVALGYALAALDLKAKNKRESLAAFGSAAFSNPMDADAHLGLGYAIRFYASLEKQEAVRRAEITRAVASLQEAARLRPNFFATHRELAFCYIALGDAEAALRECNMARANRGGAADANEVAGIEVAMSGLHSKIAQTSSGEKRERNEAASQGFLSEAKETAPGGDLKIALSVLNSAGVSTSLASFLPRELLPLLDIKGSIENEIRERLPGGLGGIRIPGF